MIAVLAFQEVLDASIPLPLRAGVFKLQLAEPYYLAPRSPHGSESLVAGERWQLIAAPLLLNFQIRQGEQPHRRLDKLALHARKSAQGWAGQRTAMGDVGPAPAHGPGLHHLFSPWGQKTERTLTSRWGHNLIHCSWLSPLPWHPLLSLTREEC